MFKSVFSFTERELRSTSTRLKESNGNDYCDDDFNYFIREFNNCTVKTWKDDHLNSFSYNDMSSILFNNLEEGIMKIILLKSRYIIENSFYIIIYHILFIIYLLFYYS